MASDESEYGTSSGWSLQRQDWRNHIPSRITRAWVSEIGGFGNSAQNVADMASNIILDINLTRITAWIFWQALDGHPDWTLIHPYADCLNCFWSFNPDTFNPIPKLSFYGVMQFSNHIPHGSIILSSSRSSDLDPCTICVAIAYVPKLSQLTIVAVNNNATLTQTHTFDLSLVKGVSSANTVVMAYRTSGLTGELHQLIDTNVPVIADHMIAYTIPALSITTFLVYGVSY
eukprot:jgi/Hompol1/1976/HPOL_005316-RA